MHFRSVNFSMPSSIAVLLFDEPFEGLRLQM
jgi:hypothetical protein